MFIVCNYLDVEHKDAQKNAIVLEECKVYNDALADYEIVCYEHKLPLILEWVNNNMGKRKDMFTKQFDRDPIKAAMFMKHVGGVHSFTEEIVNEVGGLEQFKQRFCNKPIVKDFTQISSFGEEHISESELVSEQIQEPETIPAQISEVESKLKFDSAQTAESEFARIEESQTEPELESESEPESEPEQEPAFSELSMSVTMQSRNDENFTDAAIDSTEKDMLCNSEEEDTNALRVDEISKQEDATVIKIPVEERNVPVCQKSCIYNPDGTFKGFTDGQIVSLLHKLKEFDNQLVLADLDPDYILSEKDLQAAAERVDTFSPSAIKAFILYKIKQCSNEEERIRVTWLLDELCNFILTLGGN